MKNSRDVDRMSKAELISYLTELNNTANERIAKLRKAGIQFESIAYREQVLDRGKRKFTIPKKKTVEELKTNIYSAQQFIRSYSSKVELVERDFNDFQANLGVSISKNQYRNYVKNYSKTKDKIESSGVYLDSEQTVNLIKLSFKVKGGVNNLFEQFIETLPTEEQTIISENLFEI